jgi:hypothetical protein
LVESNLKSVLIASVNAPNAPANTQKKESIAQKKNQEIDDILKK